MGKRKSMFISAFVIGMLLVAFLGSTVYATQVTEDSQKHYVGITEMRTNDEPNMGYGIGDPKTNGENGRGVTIWNLIEYASSADDAGLKIDGNKNIYCLKAGVGFSNENKRATYDIFFDMKNKEEILAGNNDLLTSLINEKSFTLDDGTEVSRYDALVALADMLFLIDDSDEETYTENIKKYLEKAKIYDYAYDVLLTRDDIAAVQQAAIWYFTNYEEEDGKYDKTSPSTGWLTYVLDPKDDYTSLSDYRTAELYDEGEQRQEQAEILYNYLINTAKENAKKSSESSDEPITIDTEVLQYEETVQNYIVGPIKITEQEGNTKGYDITIAIKNKNIDIQDYILLDSNKEELPSETTINDLVGKGFYIQIPKVEETTDKGMLTDEEIIIADVNGNGMVDSQDSEWILKKEAGIEEDGFVDGRGDVDGNGTIDYNDSVKVLQYIEYQGIRISTTVEYETNKLEVWVSSSTAKVEQPILMPTTEKKEANIELGVVPLEKDLDLALRKYITVVGGNTLSDTNSRVPNIDTSSLVDGTTAIYKHKKDPVEVKTNDEIIYNITIYNEGEKEARATKIIDQLPTGLEFVEVVSGNFEESNYDETSNMLTLTRKADNNENLAGYTGEGDLASETIQIKCRVVATAGATDKVLTNLAWIAEEVDGVTGEVITTEVGKDRDSEPSTIETQTKDELVTEDTGYTGNESNQDKELANSEEYFEGQQDDDDFEKIVIKAVTSVKVIKTWSDANNQDGVRPENVVVQLYKNGTSMGDSYKVTLPIDGKWEYEWSGLPQKEDGEDIEYTVKELNNEGIAVEDGTAYDDNYTATYVIEGNTTTITNTHTPELTSISVNKVWDDDNNQDGLRLPEIEVELLKNGEPTGTTKKLNEENNWTATFDNLPLKENGVEIEYTVRENTEMPGYTIDIAEATDNNFTITNTHTPGETSVKVIKTWNDSENQDGVRPENITVQLYKNGESMGDSYKVTLPIDGKWEYEWTRLPQKEDGIDITYTVKELNNEDVAVEDGTAYDDNYIATYEVSGNTTTITNTHTPELTSITVNKVWNDNNNQDGLRLPEIEVELLKNGEPTGTTAKLNEGNNWTATFDNLPLKENGVEIEYTVREITEVPEYETSIEETSDNNFTITNSYTPGETSVKVIKTWNDSENQDGVRPENVVVQLYKNGESMGDSYKVTLPIDGNWEYEWTRLPQKEDGIDITYTVKELNNEGIAVEDGTAYDDNYTATYAVQGNTTTITNTHTPGETSVKVIKTWNDSENQDGVRPENITVQLYKNGESMGDSYKVTLPIDGKWEYEWTGLELKENGENVEYTVKELNNEGVAVEDGTAYDDNYTATYAIEGNTTTITNTHIVKEFDLALRKFIVAVSKDETIEESELLQNEDGSYIREPVVDTSKLNTTDEEGNKITTATYNHTKEPVAVQTNDYVVYVLKVYNEGERDGYAGEIKDYLPEYLEYVDNEFNRQYGWEVSEDGRTVSSRYLENTLIGKAEQDENGNYVLSYAELPIMCKISETAKTNENMTNIAEITEYQDENKQPVEDRDSQEDNVNVPGDEELPGYKEDETGEYIPGQQDDDDFEKVIVQNFDLALRKFIVAVSKDETVEESELLQNEDGSYTREPVVDTSKLNTTDEEGNKITTATYNHTKESVLVQPNDYVIYMLRVYNEGDINGYAGEVKDYLPPYLEYVDSEFNKEYGWEVSEDGRIVTTNYLADTLITKAEADENGNYTLEYAEVPIMCKVSENPNTNENITNIAEITEYLDENKESVGDRDSGEDNVNVPNDEELPGYKDDETGEYIPGQQDDDDFEKVIVKIFDLSLRKWVTQAIVTDNTTGQTTVTQTGHQPYDDPEDIVKVELYRKNINDVTVKFKYSIRVTNEGEIAGYAKEVTDYVPEGLKFLAEDNPNWTDEGNNIISTKQLENTLLQPGEYTEVEVTLTWINNEDNMGVMNNIAEISQDYNEYEIPDIDSTPDNQVDGEDDIDDAPVMLSISTGRAKLYLGLGLIILITIAGGVTLIKKFVL